jgi:hypothetical protein
VNNGNGSVALVSNQDQTSDDQSWLEWFNRTSLQEALPNPVLSAPIVLGIRVALGTPQQRQQYVHDFIDAGNPPLTAVVRASRYKAVYGVWPDGSKDGPQLPRGLREDRVKWLLGQSTIGKFQKWLRELDPSADAAIAEHHAAKKAENLAVQQAHLKQQEERREQKLLDERRRLSHTLEVLTRERRELRGWFMRNNNQSSHDEWAKNFLRLRDVEQLIECQFGKTEDAEAFLFDRRPHWFRLRENRAIDPEAIRQYRQHCQRQRSRRSAKHRRPDRRQLIDARPTTQIEINTGSD